MKPITVRKQVAGRSFDITLTQVRTTVWDWEASVDGIFYASGSTPATTQENAVKAITWELYDLVIAEHERAI